MHWQYYMAETRRQRGVIRLSERVRVTCLDSEYYSYALQFDSQCFDCTAGSAFFLFRSTNKVLQCLYNNCLYGQFSCNLVFSMKSGAHLDTASHMQGKEKKNICESKHHW